MSAAVSWIAAKRSEQVFPPRRELAFPAEQGSQARVGFDVVGIALQGGREALDGIAAQAQTCVYYSQVKAGVGAAGLLFQCLDQFSFGLTELPLPFQNQP